MKTFLICTLAILMMGCSGNKTDKGNTASNTASGEIINSPGANADDDNPFETVVATYTAEQLKQLLGKSEPQDIRDLLVLLPDTLCFDYSAADRRKVARGERVGEYGGMALGEVDLANGYLNLSGAWEGIWEMFGRKEGKGWIFAVNQQYCGPRCYTHIADTYTFEDGKLIRHSYANLAGYQDLWVELFIDFDQLTPEQQASVNRIWNEEWEEWKDSDYSCVLFRLPRDGKTITMYVDRLPYLEEGIPETAFKEVTAAMWSDTE